MAGARPAAHALPDDVLERIRAQLSWQNRVAAAHTVPREIRVFDAYRFDPREAARVRVATVLLVGSDSEPWWSDVGVVSAALPDACVVELTGQGNAADVLAPEVVVAQLREQLLVGR